VPAYRAVLAVTRIVAMRALGLGDFLTAVPALRALRRHGRVTVAAPRALAPLAALAGVDLVDAGELEPLSRELHGADLLVNLHGRGPQSHRVALAAAPRRLLAFTHPGVAETAALPEWRADEHETVRWCRLLREGGVAADPARLRLPPPPPAPELAWARGATIVHPGAASAARRWPPQRFACVARAETAAGRTVVVTGGVGELALAAEVAAAAGLPRQFVLAGRTTLAQLAALVAHAGRVVCGDTGIAHLASAFGTPSLVLFGPVPPSRWGPPVAAGLRTRHRVMWAGLHGDPHADRPHEGLLRLMPEEVVAELAALP
jgi:ADP-heptose:LPS heptosyltransferase